MGMPLYACNPPTGYSNRGADWLNPSAQLYRMNFSLDLAAAAVAGVSADIPGLIRAGGGTTDDPASAAEAINAQVFGRTLSAASLAAASQLDRSGSVSVAVRVAGLLFASPEMQVR
jgi:nitrate/nitrite transporter NarK